MYWNVPPGALPGSATFVRVLDRWWTTDGLVVIIKPDICGLLSTLCVSLVPRPERGGERAWYLLAAHAPTTPGKSGVTLLGFT
jgi:hypothetical protein